MNSFVLIWTPTVYALSLLFLILYPTFSDKDNNILDTYPVTTEYPTSIGTGRKAKASEAYALNNSDNYIELEFYDNMCNSNSDCVFKLNW